MTPSDILTAFSIRIYEPPLSAMREDGTITDLTNPISVMMLIQDFETEYLMNGILDFLGNSTGLYAQETVAALRQIGAQTEADQLADILRITSAAGLTHSSIQTDRQSLPADTITSFRQLHGSKWAEASDAATHLAADIDFSRIWLAAELYISAHQADCQEALQ